MQEGMYDLAIDGRDKVIVINGQQDWLEVQPGTTVVLRVVLLQRESADVQSISAHGVACGTMGLKVPYRLIGESLVPYVTMNLISPKPRMRRPISNIQRFPGTWYQIQWKSGT